MPKPQIKWPKGGSPTIKVSENGLVVASGRADDSIVRVYGRWWPTASPDDVRTAATVAFYRPQKGNPHFRRWQIAFKVPTEGRYTLSVTGVTADGQEDESHRDFRAVLTPRFIDIISPDGSEPITDQADDFVAYGNLTDHPLGTVKMTRQDGLIIYPEYTVSDVTDLFFWSAQFPTLPSGTYVLSVEDNVGGSSAQQPGLVV